MLHLLSSLLFLVVLAAGGGVLVGLLHQDAARIAAALLREPLPTVRRAAPTRVRMTASRPASFRVGPLRAAA